MLYAINKIYLLASILLYLTLSTKISGDYLLINLFALFSFISYFGMLELNRTMEIKFYNNTRLIVEVFLYAFLFVFMENLISYFYTDNFFVFSNSDAVFYHESVIEIIDMPFIDGMKHYLKGMDFDDLGMILILYPLYYVSESNLMLNAFYIFVGILMALSLFSLSRQFMSRKYAFLASLSFSISSFMLFFHSIGLKESFMVMLVVVSFDFYYRFMIKKTILNLMIALMFIGMLMLFRPAVSAMIIGAIGLGTLLSQKGGVGIKVVSFLIFAFLIIIGDAILAEIDKYTTGGFDTLMEAREVQGMIIGGIPFTYAVNILSQSVGPLPTVISETKVLTMLYTSGLIYRVLLAFPFWLGVIFIIKGKEAKLYPLIIFIIMEMTALTFLMDGLELRKALPHIPIVFVVAFWFLNQYDMKKIQFKNIKRFRWFFNTSLLVLTLLMFYWNFR
jgi:hypothetical protein